jgi:hypothetical protein
MADKDRNVEATGCAWLFLLIAAMALISISASLKQIAEALS